MSALVTLFANILQNPQDARARSDVKLMNLVVNFLSMLVSDESNGSVKRMLSVCSEFERIAKVVLDRAEKESHSRRKRKTPAEQKEASAGTAAATSTATNANPNAPMQSKSDSRQASSSSTVTPSSTQPQPQSFPQTFTGRSEGQNPNPTVSEDNDVSVSSGDTPVMPEFHHDFAEAMAANGMGQTGFTTGASFPGSYGAPMDIPAFQQPFVPQDLWQMPMTLEWDWADMTGAVFPDFGPPEGHSGQHNPL